MEIVVRNAFLPMTMWIRDTEIISISLVVVCGPGTGVVTTQTRTSIESDHPGTWATIQKRRDTAGLTESGPS